MDNVVTIKSVLCTVIGCVGSLVASAFGELVDALLLNGDPFGTAQILADVVLEFCRGDEGHAAS